MYCRGLGPGQTPYFTWAEPNSIIRLMWRLAFDPIKLDWFYLERAEELFRPGQPRLTPGNRLWVKRRSLNESNQTHNQRSKGAILTLPWKTTEQDRFCYLFGEADRFEWIKFDVWLRQAFFQLFEPTQNVIGFGSCEVPRLTRALEITFNVGFRNFAHLQLVGKW